MINLNNWLNNLVESVTFYGNRAGGGGTFGGGKPFNPMQQNQPFNPAFGGRPPSMPQYETINFGDGRFPQGMPPMPQGLPPMPQGMPQSQGMPPNQGQLRQNQNTPYLTNFGANRPPLGMGQPQGMPPNQGQPEGRPFNPQALQNNPYLTNYDRPPQGISQPQGLPMQDGLFAGGGRPFNPQALQNNPYLINNKIPPNFTSQGMQLPAQKPQNSMSLIGDGKPFIPTF